MPKEFEGYLAKRAQQLGLGRGEALVQIQAALEAMWPGQTRALSLNDGVLKVVTPSSSVASELRLRQVQILEQLRAITSPINRLHIQIRSLS